MSKKYLITGATGFIGSHLVKYLLDDGVPIENIRLFVLPGDSLKNLPDLGFDIFYGDIRNKGDVKKSIHNVDIVYHLAALVVKKEYTEEDYFEVNTKGTGNILECVSKSNIKKFIFFSSASVYGLPICKGDMENISESAPKDPCEVYGKSKLDAENLVISSGINYGIVRPTSVYGPRDHSSFPKLINSIKNHYFFTVGDGKNRIDYVNVRDLVRAARLVEKSVRSNEDYIIGGGPATLNQIVGTISSMTNSWTIPFMIPKYLAMFLSHLTVIFDLPFYPDRVRAMTSNFYFNLSKSKTKLKYQPLINLSQGVAEILNDD